MAEISTKTKEWLVQEYIYFKDELYDSHYWEEEHARASEKLGILSEIISGLGLWGYVNERRYQ